MDIYSHYKFNQCVRDPPDSPISEETITKLIIDIQISVPKSYPFREPKRSEAREHIFNRKRGQSVGRRKGVRLK